MCILAGLPKGGGYKVVRDGSLRSAKKGRRSRVARDSGTDPRRTANGHWNHGACSVSRLGDALRRGRETAAQSLRHAHAVGATTSAVEEACRLVAVGLQVGSGAPAMFSRHRRG